MAALLSARVSTDPGTPVNSRLLVIITYMQEGFGEEGVALTAPIPSIRMTGLSSVIPRVTR
jgi:hypothetical protein